MAYETISPVEVGDSDYTMLSASLANRVINAANASNMPIVKPEGLCHTEASDDHVSFDFSKGLQPLKDIIVVLNGTAYYTNLWTDGRLEAVT